MEQTHIAEAPMTRGIAHVAFSNNGLYLACCDMSDENNIYIFDVKSQLKPGQKWVPLASGRGGRQKLLSLGWNAQNDHVIATGIKCVLFCSWSGGKVSVKKGSGY